ncbi:MAG TPA: hypothetical protein P5234_06335 [Thermoanaerobaculaceae bacterium]|nr:hypothetical protein [Thermoanaerobaculaceae bacterium]HRS15856.1 hypothetical protein [Thermoanaerobaculaceae bacterium]
MAREPRLSLEEWRLVQELLQQELHELPSEIHHSATYEMREELRARLVTVERLLARIEQALSA